VRVAVVSGGPSSEYEVSLKTAKMVMSRLKSQKYQAEEVRVSKMGKWPISFKKLKEEFDVVFIAMHGEYGEDGKLQAKLEKEKIVFTGSGSKASKLSMDKALLSEFLKKKGVLIPEFAFLKNRAPVKNFGPVICACLPLVVKPSDRGSSVGVTIVNKLTDLAPAISEAMKYSSNIMVQKYIAGRELTCGVIEKDGKLIAFPVTEIIPKKSKFFDYKAKYVKGASEEITPAKISQKAAAEVKKQSLKIFKMAKCQSYARMDYILGEDGKIYFLEINTLPGMTETSLLPQGAKAHGIEFSSLLDIIISNALD